MKIVENRYYRFDIGDFECLVISDGEINVPVILPDNLADKVERYNPQKGQMMDSNVLIVRTGQKNILIDTGIGAGNETTAGKTLENIQAAGIRPEEIDIVIYTHVHIDHIGGNADITGKPNYPNARYIVYKKEWDYWQMMLDLLAEKIPKWEKIHVKYARKYLPPILDRLEIIDREEIMPGIKLEFAPGHSPGGITLNIASGKEQVLCIGDIVHDPVEAVAPDVYDVLDANYDDAKRTRDRVVLEAIAANTLVFASHLPFPGLGYFIQKGQLWSWKPI